MLFNLYYQTKDSEDILEEHDFEDIHDVIVFEMYFNWLQETGCNDFTAEFWNVHWLCVRTSLRYIIKYGRI